MATSLADSQMWHRLYGDAELGQLFTDSAEVRAMLLVEGALARVQGRLGMIPEVSGEAIARAAREVLIDPGALAAGAARDGVVVPALVAAFREAMQAPEHAAYVHWGATSQDIQDSGLVLRLRRALDIMEARLRALVAALAEQAQTHAGTVIVARTRWQAATPTTLGARIAAWGMPLVRHLDRLDGLRDRLLVLSLAGASGTLSAMGEQGPEVAKGVAEELSLRWEPVPWHSARDGVAELAGWLGLVNLSLAKLAGDLLGAALAQEGLRAGAGGGSSTMPHKQNPTGAEALRALSAANLGAVAQVQAGTAQGFERDGAAWGQEMLALPGLIVGSGAALRVANDLARSLEVDAERVRAVLDDTAGFVFAEAAAFAWAAELGLPDARQRVKEACATATRQGVGLREVLEAEAPGIDWASVFHGPAATGQADRIAEAFMAAARGVASLD